MIRMAKNINYKKLVLYEGDAKYWDDPVTSTYFYGFEWMVQHYDIKTPTPTT
jgi:hypothetical protein